MSTWVIVFFYFKMVQKYSNLVICEVYELILALKIVKNRTFVLVLTDVQFFRL